MSLSNLTKILFATSMIFLPLKNILAQENYILKDFNDDQIKDSLFWEKEEVITTKNFFSQKKVNYYLILKKTNSKTDTIYSSSFQPANGKIPETPKLNIEENCVGINTIHFWRGPYITDLNRKISQDIYYKTEIDINPKGKYTKQKNVFKENEIIMKISPSEFVK